MPLSKKRNRDRMRGIRLHNQKLDKPVQPKYIIYEGQRVEVPELDADGQVIYDTT